MLNYGQILVEGGVARTIRTALEQLSESAEGSKYNSFLKAWRKWTNRDTQNSIIIDIPPNQSPAEVELVTREAEAFRAYFSSRFGKDISVINKAATTGGVTSVRLYVRPGKLEDGTELSKGNCLKYYFNQNGISNMEGKLVYFADKFATPEEISLGRYALIGVEIDTAQKTPAVEFGKYGVPVLITVPTYLKGADIVRKVLQTLPSRRETSSYSWAA